MTWDEVLAQLRTESLRLAEQCQTKRYTDLAARAFAAFAVAEGIAKFAADTPGVAEAVVDPSVTEALTKFMADTHAIVEPSAHPPLPARALRHGS